MKIRPVWLFVLALFSLLPFLGMTPLLDWDETNFAEAAREMLLTGDYGKVQIGFQPFWEKPPLFFWLQAFSFKVFGINEWAARFPNVLAALATLASLLYLGRRFRSKDFGFYWAGLYLSSFLPFFYFRTALIDPWFNLFTFWAFSSLYFFDQGNKAQDFWIASLAGAFAVMTKGPTAVFIIALAICVMTLAERKHWVRRITYGLLFTVISLLPYVIWMASLSAQDGGKTAGDFYSYLIRLFSTADAGHRGFPLYHFVVLAVGCFPASFFLFKGWKAEKKSDEWMRGLLLIVLAVFTLVQTKIIHYSSLAYFPLTYLAAIGLEKWLSAKRPDQKRFLAVGLSAAFFLLLFTIPLLSVYAEKIAPVIQDPYAQAALLEIRPFNWGMVLGFLPISLVFLYALDFPRPSSSGQWALLYLSIHFVAFTHWVIRDVPKIAEIVQGPMVGFFKKAAAEKVDIEPYGFKSYSYLFYSNAQPQPREKKYRVTKLQDAESLKQTHSVSEVERKGGWVLFKNEARKR